MHRRLRHRRGSIYILVMGMTLLVSTMSLITLFVLRVDGRTRTLNADMLQAEILARAAIEKARLMIKNDTDWRANQNNGVWWSDTATNISAQVEVIDPSDGDLADGMDETIRVTGTATYGTATQKLAVDMYPVYKPIDALTYGMHVHGPMSIALGRTINATGAPISANSLVTSSGVINAHLQAPAYLPILGTIPGSYTQRSTSIDKPDPDIIDDYQALATTITYFGDMVRVCLTSTRNPWGATNADGVYYINTGGNDLLIEDSRIQGTLVVRCGSVGKKVQLSNTVFMQPARADYPVIITDGEIELDYSSNGTYLSESNEGTNFNPMDAPFNGSSDTDTSDFYPSEVQGLIHARGPLRFSDSARVVGAIIAEGSNPSNYNGSNMTINFDSQLQTVPPVGYRIYEMKISPGSWRRVIN